jgi:hypothetical protein
MRRACLAAIVVAGFFGSGICMANAGGKNDLSNSQKTEAIENMGTVVAAMRKCDNLTIQPSALKVVLSSLKTLGVDVETVNAPTITFMSSQMEFEVEYKKDPSMTCKLAMAKFPKVLEYTK